MKLNLGVLDVSYSDARNGDGATTTGEVAEILEERYHVMEVFYESRANQIGDWMADAMAAEIENVTLGKRPNMTPTMDAEQKIEAEFRSFLDADEWSQTAPLTQQIGAAQMGVSHRKKKPYSSENAARPAFIDTGLYQASFRAWVEPDSN